ncbi:MAG: hypothetical protein R6W90_16025 [Ignavibacteriaceae bacterium]
MRFIIVVVLVMLAVSPFYAQENPNDTLKTVTTPLVNRLQEMEYNMPDFELYRNLYFDEDLPAADSNSIWLWTSYVLSNNHSQHFLPGNIEPHMLANYHQMYIEDSKFNVVKTVLAMAQAGAVGYLAYRSIKEHGFWDNK